MTDDQPPVPARVPQRAVVLLPLSAAYRLMRASEVRDEYKRRVAIDDAIDYVKRAYPNYFNHQ